MATSIGSKCANSSKEQDELVSTEDGESVEKKSAVTKASKRNWRKKLIYLFLLLLLLYPLSLLVINSSWVKSKITNKLEEKTGLEWHVGSILWVPFGDIYVNDLKTVSDDDSDSGGISLDMISVSPVWARIIGGDLVWSELRIGGAELDVERAWLENMIKKSSVSSQPKLKEDAKQLPPVKVKPVNPEEMKPPVAQNPKPKPPKPPKIAKPEKSLKPSTPEQTIFITGLKIKVREKDETWFQSDDISMDIPIGGKGRKGSIRILSGAGNEEVLPVVWDEKDVVIDKSGIELFGVKMNIKSRIRTSTGSRSFAYQIEIDDQPYHYDILHPNLKVKIEAERLRGQFFMRGNLLSPQTWNGFGGVQFTHLSIEETQKTHKKLQFDEVYAKGRMMQGHLLIDDAAARSELLTFMANGVLSKDTYAYGVLRCVANDDFSEKLNRIYHGSHVIHLDRSAYFLFEHLDNPDRRYFDLYFDGKLATMEFKHNRSDRWQSLSQFFKNLKRFKDHELREDGLFQPEKETF